MAGPTGLLPAEEQLAIALRGVIGTDEVVAIIDELQLAERLGARSDLTDKVVSVRSLTTIHADLARRNYYIRCRGVYSKSSGRREGGPGLLPGTEHEDLIQTELPLVEYLAQRARIVAAQPQN